MSRIFHNSSRILPSIFGNSSVTPNQSPVTNTQTTQQRNVHRRSGSYQEERQDPPPSLKLPEYSNTGQMSYVNFIERIRSLNPAQQKSQSQLNQTEIEQALRSTFQNVVGGKRFRAIKKKKQGRSPQSETDAWEWDRLMYESREYWEAEKRAKNAAIRAAAEAEKKR